MSSEHPHLLHGAEIAALPARLAPLAQGTRLTLLQRYETKEERDEVAASGVELRTDENLARLDAAVAGL